MLKKLVIYFIRKFKGLKVGYGTTINNSKFSKNNWLGRNVSITNTSLKKYTYLSDETKVRDTTMGAFCSIGRNVKIGLGFHPINYLSTSPFLYRKHFLGISGLCDRDMFTEDDYRETIIGNDVWIGDNVIICGGCSIGDGVVIGAGSIVTKDLAPYGVYAGNPARFIKSREVRYPNHKNYNEKWWEYNDCEIKKILRIYNE